MPSLLKARVRVKKGDTKVLEKLIVDMQQARGSYVSVGILEPDRRYPPTQPVRKPGQRRAPKAAPGPTLGQVAAWMEFGTHSKTGVEIVPARSFIRSPIDRGLPGIERVKARALASLMAGKVSLEKALGTIGAECQRRMQNAIIKAEHGIPLDAKTIAKKRELGQPDIPLIATGLLKSSIAFAVTLAAATKKRR